MFKYIYFCFILLFTSSSLCRKDQFAVSYFSTSLIVLIQVYNWEIRQWFVAVDLLTFYILYRSVSLVLSFVSNYYVFAFWGLLLYFPPDISTSPLFLGGGGNASPPSDRKNSSSMGEISSACVEFVRWRMTWRKWKRKWWYQVSLRNSLVEQFTNGVTDILSPDTYNLFAIIEPSL